MNRVLPGSAAWYVRRGTEVTGPFPHGLLLQYRELGRLKASDEVSADGVNWFLIDEVPSLAAVTLEAAEAGAAPDTGGEVDWARERSRARRRWLEERWIPDRRSGETKDASGRPRGPDRRKDPQAREAVHFASEKTTHDQRRATFVVALIVLASVAVIGLALWRFAPPSDLKVVLVRPAMANCAATAGPGVRWTGCDKRHAVLVGAVLTGADLSNAILIGADLSGSLLEGATLRNADLRGANLEGASVVNADLSGARLDEAKWVDGSICAPDSVGSCVGASR